MTNALDELLASARSHVADPRVGLPEAVFHFASELTPMVNVDLLIKNKQGQTLLTWRADAFHGPAWHIPGGIVRFKETTAERIRKVAQAELGCEVRFSSQPVHVFELMHPTRSVRGHFISLLYPCELVSEPAADRKFMSGKPAPGDWAWHAGTPPDFLKAQAPLRQYIDDTAVL